MASTNKRHKVDQENRLFKMYGKYFFIMHENANFNHFYVQSVQIKTLLPDEIFCETRFLLGISSGSMGG